MADRPHLKQLKWQPRTDGTVDITLAVEFPTEAEAKAAADHWVDWWLVQPTAKDVSIDIQVTR